MVYTYSQLFIAYLFITYYYPAFVREKSYSYFYRTRIIVGWLLSLIRTAVVAIAHL